ncbi:geobacillin-26 family protein [Sporosarcina trichiuri]|uniref:geobacillin-26 family protein n=1 Tax=Sporosarcina trichiuri TaxID=3056445 RepID=UPI0025B52184|nr:geobacillin-26 family protein [Sporosarcina sp. 0.2-SM1T-5]WJY26111.1 geobacillin-26 family protein [Sporosarcina sp. 0.2-SM1T-5]
MLKNVKRILLVLAALILLSTAATPVTVFASASDGSPVVLKDTGIERVVQTVTDGVVTKAVYNKKLNLLTIEETGHKPVTYNMTELTRQAVADELITVSPEEPQLGMLAATTKQKTFMNYEYIITHGSTEKWELRRPKEDSLFKYYYKKVNRTASNKGNLASFQTAVENINYYEFKAIGSSLTSLGLSWLSFILSVPTAGAGTLTAGLAALGAYGTALDSLVKLHRHANLANTYYHRVK